MLRAESTHTYTVLEEEAGLTSRFLKESKRVEGTQINTVRWGRPGAVDSVDPDGLKPDMPPTALASQSGPYRPSLPDASQMHNQRKAGSVHLTAGRPATRSPQPSTPESRHPPPQCPSGGPGSWGAAVPLPPASEPLPGQASRKLFCSSAERLPRSAFKTPVFSFCWSRRRVRSKEGLASFCPVSVLPLGSWLFPPYFSCLTQESQPGPSEMSHCRREREADLDPQRTEEGRGHRPCSPACAHGSPASWRGWTGTG